MSVFALRSLFDLLDSFGDSVASSLSVDHDSEALEVGEVGPSLSFLEFLGVGSLVKGGLDVVFLEGLEDSASASSAEHRNTMFGQGKSLDGVLAAREVRSVNEDGVHITDIDNNDALSVILSVRDPADSAGLNHISEDH
jgi:hypothetical protein